MTTTHAGKSVFHIGDRLLDLLKQGFDAEADGSDEARKKYERDADQVRHDTAADSAEEARSEVKERLTKHLMDKGMSKDAAERLFDARWKDVFDRAEKMRSSAVHRVGADIAWLAGIAASIFIGALGVSAVHSRLADGPQREALNLLKSTEAQQRNIDVMASISISDDDFNLLTVNLFVPTPTDSPALQPAAAPLPAPLVAAAAVPAQVVETTASGQTHTVMSTVREVYERSPPAVREAMERSPPSPPIDHGYDHDDQNDCFHTHCLGSNHNTKDYTITNGDGSASISISIRH